MHVDVAVVGGGGAGLSVLLALDRLQVHGLSVALVDPVRRSGSDRTWCFWDHGTSPVERAVFRSWPAAEVVAADGTVHRLDLSPLRYVMVRSPEFYAAAAEAAERLGVVRVAAPARFVVDGAERAHVGTADGIVAARWVLDSRPGPPRRPARTALLQHFRGWTLRAPAAVLPDVPVLMDFRARQPAGGLSFGYVLPHDARTGLVEYTEFSRSRLTDDAYGSALRHYLGVRLPGIDPAALEVLEVEDGAVPMTDAVHARRTGRRVIRLGTAGGATRPSTGYTFAAMQRQAGAVAAALRDGRVPLPPPAYPRRHRWMDAVLLRALDQGLVDGPGLFGRLFAEQPAERVLRFLDGVTTPAEELAIMRSTPAAAMSRSAARDAVARLQNRVPHRGRAPSG